MAERSEGNRKAGGGEKLQIKREIGTDVTDKRRAWEMSGEWTSDEWWCGGRWPLAVP